MLSDQAEAAPAPMVLPALQSPCCVLPHWQASAVVFILTHPGFLREGSESRLAKYQKLN